MRAVEDDRDELEQTRRHLLSRQGVKRYQAYDKADGRPVRTGREHYLIVVANFGGEKDDV